MSRSQWILTLLLFACIVSPCFAVARGPEPFHVVLFLFFGIGVGVSFVQILNYLKDPVHYTICVFVAGILFSLATGQGHGSFGESLSMWINIDAELLLYVFLPPLIFGEAMHLNWYQARRAFKQGIMLAGPGVILGTVLMGCFMKAVQPSWSWNLAMIFGAITSATDTVAVVALLKTAGASAKLTMIVVGESLLNDGTAMVLFEVFFGQMKGEAMGFGEAIAYILSAFFGSFVIGAVMGYLGVCWLRTFKRPLNDTDVLMQIAITIFVAYATFYVNQSTLQLSGAVGCTGAGMMFAWLAPPYILHHAAMKRIWSMMEWMLDTTIFLLSGLIIGAESFDHVNASDWGVLIGLYLLLMFVRAVVVAACYPFISRMGYKCTPREAVFLVWGGLRGAVGLALAMMTDRNGPVGLEKETSKMLFYVGGIAGITLVLNATTITLLLAKLGLAGAVSAEKRMIQSSVIKKLEHELCRDLEDLAIQFEFEEKHLTKVCQRISLLNDVDVTKLMHRITKRREANLSGDGDDDSINSEHGSTHGLEPELCSTPLSFRPFQQTEMSPFHAGQQTEMSPFHAGQESSTPHSFRPFQQTELSPVRVGQQPEMSPFHANQQSAVDSAKVIDTENDTAAAPPATSATAPATPSDKGLYAGRKPNRLEEQANRFRAKSLYATETSSKKQRDYCAMPLLQQIRFTFLSVVRVHYWHDIETGRLPRGSKSERFLLYTIEVALDEAEHETDGARDWVCMKEKLDWVSYKFRILSWLEQMIPDGYSGAISQYLNALEHKREERAAYILTSFIAAHESAQRKIHGYITPQGSTDEFELSLEEMQVISESKHAVASARRRLDTINPAIIGALKLRQAVALLLTRQSDILNEMIQEGLVSSTDAEDVLTALNDDLSRMQQKENRTILKLGQWLKERRKELRKDGSWNGWTRL